MSDSSFESLADSLLEALEEGLGHVADAELQGGVLTVEGDEGTAFVVWAPNAERVSVVGDWCNWDGRQFPMRRLDGSGLWEIFVPGVAINALYKFELRTREGLLRLKSDPMGFKMQQAPETASIVVAEGTYRWRDASWMTARAIPK